MARDQQILAGSCREGLIGNGDCGIEGYTWRLARFIKQCCFTRLVTSYAGNKLLVT